MDTDLSIRVNPHFFCVIRGCVLPSSITNLKPDTLQDRTCSGRDFL